MAVHRFQINVGIDQRSRILWAWLGLYTMLTIVVAHHGFFWDTILLAGKHALWFDARGLGAWLLPEQLDSGHPPTTGWWVALCWRLFGTSLPVAHYAMLPFLWGIAWFTWRICMFLLPPRWVALSMSLMLLDPTLLAQATLVSPDLVLMFFYLGCFYALITERRGMFAILLILLGMTSMRGMMAMVAICFTDIAWMYKPTFYGWLKTCFRRIPVYLPAIAVTAGWIIWHHQSAGFTGYTPDYEWAPLFVRVDFHGFLRNVGIVGWRILDFGRVFVWIPAAILLLLAMQNGLWQRFPRMRFLFAAALLPMLALSPSMLMYKNLAGHRYLLPVYLLMTLFLVYTWAHLSLSRLWMHISALGLLTGHLWTYPEGVAMGWDCTLGHLPYYQVRQDMIRWMDEHQIDLASVGSDFPNVSGTRATDLEPVDRRFHPKDLTQDSLVLYSNVFNGFQESDIVELRTKWLLIHQEVVWGIRMELYQKPH